MTVNDIRLGNLSEWESDLPTSWASGRYRSLVVVQLGEVQRPGWNW
jgi:hypothetical protein